MKPEMLREYCDFQLSVDEMAYLNQIASQDITISTLIKAKQHQGRLTIRLTRNEAEKLRGFLTVQLASKGFDINYSPTKEGQMLELLIDRFYFRGNFPV